MDPMTLMAIAGMAAKGIGAAGKIAGGLSDAHTALFANTPAQDARDMLPSMMGQMSNGGVYDPNGQYQQSLEQRGVRQQVQNANMDNKAANESLKRRYVLDSYGKAQDSSMGAINNYLQGAQAAMLGRQQLARAY